MPSPDGAPPRMVIGMLTYNGLHHTRRCIESLLAHTRAPFRVLLLDNASTDDTPDYLRALTDHRIRVHCGEQNLGVGGGRNWLLAHITPTLRDNDLIVLLDNDIEVAEGWETPFLEAFEARPALGVAGRWAFSMLVHDTWRDILPEDSADSGPVDTVQGCCFWIRASAARAVGAFDTQLGRFWHEDDDYSIRALAAGFDVRRVWTDRITHHEHGSGVALHPDKLAGSRHNQAYLAKKWRAMDAIDDAGVPRRPFADPDVSLRDELSRRLGRPLVRTEMNSATMHVTRMLHAELGDAELGALASPVARELLRAMTTMGGSTEAPARAVESRVQALLQRRRATAWNDEPAPRAFSGICNPEAWDDPRWAGVYERAFRDGSGRDATARTETAWRDGQLFSAMRTLGVLRKDASVLLVGSADEPLVGALSPLVSRLVVADSGTMAAAKCTPDGIASQGDGPVDAVSWPSDVSGRRFDAVVCPNLGRFASAGETRALLGALAQCARAGGVVAAAATVRIAGPSDARWLEAGRLRDASHLAEHGLRLIGAFDGAVRDELLLRAVPAHSSLTLRPGVARCVDATILTLATLVARVS